MGETQTTRDKRGSDVEPEKFEELSSFWKNSRQPSNYSQEPLHRMEMHRVNINKRFPPRNMTGSPSYLLFVDNLRQRETEMQPAAFFRTQDDVSL